MTNLRERYKRKKEWAQDKDVATVVREARRCVTLHLRSERGERKDLYALLAWACIDLLQKRGYYDDKRDELLDLYETLTPMWAIPGTKTRLTEAPDTWFWMRWTVDGIICSSVVQSEWSRERNHEYWFTWKGGAYVGRFPSGREARAATGCPY